MVWFFAILTGLFVVLLLPFDNPWLALLGGVVVTAGLYFFARRVNGPPRGKRGPRPR